MKKILIIIYLTLSWQANAQKIPSERNLVDSFFHTSLENSWAYQDLKFLCKEIGARLSGTEELEDAINWIDTLAQNTFYADTVYRQEVMVPKWSRGRENAYCYSKNGRKKLKVSQLGFSVGTGLYKINGLGIYFNDLEELKEADKEEVSGKIVVIDKAFDDKLYDPFHAYGACISQRTTAAVEAAKKGAIAVLIRSLTNEWDEHPHTGTMAYQEGVDSIPAAALSWESAENLRNILAEDPETTIYLKLVAENEAPTLSHNVIAELKGKKSPEKIITIGAHIDSWDIGEGAHDDGAGVVQVLDVLRLFEKYQYQNNHTIRFVWFTNEENGAKGALKYAQMAEKNHENHLFAIESDRGGFSPRGFSYFCQDPVKKQTFLSQIDALKKYGIHIAQEGYPGVDIFPLKKVDSSVLLVGLYPDPQRYFAYHHAKSDVFESVNRRELQLGAASMASLAYLLDQALAE
ncbi:MAG: M20/M25/M40 family metallo-hydrolase [Flavobacteriales bacterium]|jgi:hypothetical protein|nr:M20/M25/M40 family metallo-hydrolase [Flavobacteriales bacterium]